MKTSELGKNFLVRFDYPNVSETLVEAFMDLAPGGIIVNNQLINDCLHSERSISEKIPELAESLESGFILAVEMSEIDIFASDLERSFALNEAAQTKNLSFTLAKEIGANLRAIGVDLLLGPALDLLALGTSAKKNNARGSSAWTDNSDQAIEFGCNFIAGCAASGLLCAPGSFPGDGSVRMDEEGIMRNNLTFDELRHRDMAPFAAALDLGVGAVIFSAAQFTSRNREQAGFMKREFMDTLRYEFDYRGVTIAGPFVGTHLETLYDKGELVLQAVQNGIDLFLGVDVHEGLELREKLADIHKLQLVPKKTLEESANRKHEFFGRFGLTRNLPSPQRPRR